MAYCRRNTTTGVPIQDLVSRAILKKWCRGCEDFVTLDKFNADRSRRDGLESLCRGCSNRKRNERRRRLGR